MPSAQELEIQVARMRRTMRTVIGLVTVGTFVGLFVVVAVVGATLSVVDKNATQMLMGEPRKAEQAPPKTEQAKSEQAKSEQAQTARANAGPAASPASGTADPARERTTPMDAPAPTATATRSASPPPAAAAPAPAQTTGAASPEAPPTAAPAAAAPKQADTPPEPARKLEIRKRVVRARPDRVTNPEAAARDASQGPSQGPWVGEPAWSEPAARRNATPERSPRRGYARVRPEDADRTRSADEDSDRVNVITTRRPRYARPDMPDRPVYEEREAPRESPLGSPRDGGLFGAFFGRQDD